MDVTQQIAEIDEVILKKDFGDKVSFWGAIDTQKVLPYGTPNEVKEEVRNRIEDLAPRGGYILASCHNIQAGVLQRIFVLCSKQQLNMVNIKRNNLLYSITEERRKE